MRLYVDCEFTDFICCELISVALVSETGEEFYGERCDFDSSACSEFVRAAVLPQLGQFSRYIYAATELRKALLDWWSAVSAQGQECLICVDNATDWDLLIDLLGEVPCGWRGLLVAHLIDRERQEAYFSEYGGRHHALHDARALRASSPEDLSNVVSIVDMKPSRYGF